MAKTGSAQSNYVPFLLGPLSPPLLGILALDTLGMEHQRRGNPGQVSQSFPEGPWHTSPHVPQPYASPVGVSLPGQGCSSPSSPDFLQAPTREAQHPSNSPRREGGGVEVSLNSINGTSL